ncbi:MAG: hypothetical protein HY986_13445 [Candidatus Melainabacteria bacterium]|nr:hypothetical protein [Candidatus Melainabacteria bacterium]
MKIEVHAEMTLKVLGQTDSIVIPASAKLAVRSAAIIERTYPRFERTKNLEAIIEKNGKNLVLSFPENLHSGDVLKIELIVSEKVASQTLRGCKAQTWGSIQAFPRAMSFQPSKSMAGVTATAQTEQYDASHRRFHAFC